MCCEGILVGRKLAHRFINGTTQLTATRVVPADARRISLIISAALAVSQWFKSDNTVAVNNGFVLGALERPIHLTVEQHGQLVTGELWGINNTGSQPFNAVEIFMPTEECKE